ncbi:hypothetical protein IKG49_00385 [Candidatus Saccharibacteria bacterium]|nr:hypothetical protein [Candidatus Saccharibacteria bacterium]
MPEDNTYTTSTPPASRPDDVMPPVVDPDAPISDASVSDTTQAPIPPVDIPMSSSTPTDVPIQATPPVQPVVDDSMPQPAAPVFNDQDLTAPISDGPIPEIYSEVARKISESHNVLIALSSDPSVDEMAAAIGLSLYLDRLGKRATAIYSGTTPNALEFLKPEETFEPTADALQDFVIALNKEKADHLRYKLDGDYVKIYITPYSAKISQDDLEFSYGDFNVDLVLALDVANGIDLDSALREHGRIMHDAIIINITTGNPGKFGEIEWSDKRASSVSEMIAKLLYSVKSDIEIGKEEATAFLTGIVAATNRFSNAQTTPETMQLSSRLMRSGANQQLISKNITPDVDNELYSLIGSGSLSEATEIKDNDPTKLDIKHGNEKGVDETKEVSGEVTEKESTLLEDLKAAEASLAQAGTETTPDLSNRPVKIDSADSMSPEDFTAKQDELLSEPIEEPTTSSEPSSPAEPLASVSMPTVDESSLPTESTSTPEVEPSDSDIDTSVKTEKVITPSADFGTTMSPEDTEKYGKMLEDAINESGISGNTDSIESNPATINTPMAASAPEINGVPDINYMPLPEDEVLPPPPTPPIEPILPIVESTPSIEPSLPTVEPTSPIEPSLPVEEPTTEPLGSQPAMQDQVYHPQVSDPSAFKIPGM